MYRKIDPMIKEIQNLIHCNQSFLNLKMKEK